MKILSVILLKKGARKADLTYFTSLPVLAGHVVSVPVRGKESLALVLSVADLEDAKSDVKSMDFNLKKISEDKGPSIFLEEFLDAAADTSKYFALPERSALAALLPALFLERYDALRDIHASQKHSAAPGEKTEAKLRSEKLLFQYPLEDRISTYKTLIREAFARKKSVFVVLPTQVDIEKLQAELGRGIEQFTHVFHSGIAVKKILAAYESAVTLEHPVLILGTAPFLSLPRRDIGTIILEHESSNAYRAVTSPHIDLRIFAELYASRIGAKFIASDELLRFETLQKETEGWHPLHPLSFRIDFSGEIEIIRREQRKRSGTFKIFEDRCLEEMAETLARGENVFVFSLRKGLATLTLCRDCGDALLCSDCGSPLVLYQSREGTKRMFVCNRCERAYPADTICGTCGGWNLVPLGIGTDTVHEEIKKLFPKVKAYKLDKEAARVASGAKKIAHAFEREHGAILVGTEMAFFYLKDKVALSVIASFETLWSIPHFRMSEKILQIALLLARITSKKMIIETKNERDPAVEAIRSGNLLAFIRSELADRKRLGYPPFHRFIKITYLGGKEETLAAKKFLSETLAAYEPEIFSGFVARLKGKFVTNALLRIPPERWSLSALVPGSKIDETLYRTLASLPPSFTVSVDPEDLL